VPLPGEVYSDDQTIPNDELIYRMVIPSNTKFDGDVAVRAQTNAFQDRRVEELEELGVPAVAVSVYLASEMVKAGSSPAALVDRWGSRYGVVSLTAGAARDAGQGIVRWPKEDDPAHGMIFVLEGEKKTNGQSKALARSSTIVVAPPPQ
jgi:hypothetical protein